MTAGTAFIQLNHQPKCAVCATGHFVGTRSASSDSACSLLAGEVVGAVVDKYEAGREGRRRGRSREKEEAV